MDMIFVPLITNTKIYGGKGGIIAHRIITETHGGSISVKSKFRKSGEYADGNSGTTIVISLPL
jgi:signal transduction histidine kinase